MPSSVSHVDAAAAAPRAPWPRWCRARSASAPRRRCSARCAASDGRVAGAPAALTLSALRSVGSVQRQDVGDRRGSAASRTPLARPELDHAAGQPAHFEPVAALEVVVHRRRHVAATRRRPVRGAPRRSPRPGRRRARGRPRPPRASRRAGRRASADSRGSARSSCASSSWCRTGRPGRRTSARSRARCRRTARP